MTRGQLIAAGIMALCGPPGWLVLGIYWWIITPTTDR